jgi:hypothetical protein
MHLEPRPSPLLNEHEAADRLNLSVRTLQQWRWAKCGPDFIKLESAVRYSEADLETFIALGHRRLTVAASR